MQSCIGPAFILPSYSSFIPLKVNVIISYQAAIKFNQNFKAQFQKIKKVLAPLFHEFHVSKYWQKSKTTLKIMNAIPHVCIDSLCITREHPYLSLYTRILCNSYANTSRHQYYTDAHKDMRIPNNYAHKTKPQCTVCTFNSTTTCELRAGSTFFSRLTYLKKYKIQFQLMHCLIG